MKIKEMHNQNNETNKINMIIMKQMKITENQCANYETHEKY